MTQHYFSQNPQIESQPNQIKVTIRNLSLSFKTDAGVFSKKGLDYGSRVLLKTFQAPDEIEGPILDVGCGYGPIGITLGQLYPDRSVTMVDINERAIQLTKENMITNQVTAEVFQSNLFNNIEGKFAAIVSNPPIRAGKSVVHEILEKAHSFLLDGGELWIVIQKKQGAPSAIKKLNGIYSEVEIKSKDKGYYVICSKR